MAESNCQDRPHPMFCYHPDANEVKAEEGASSQNESLKGSNAPHTEKAVDEESLISPPLDAREKAAENDSSDSVPVWRDSQAALPFRLAL